MKTLFQISAAATIIFLFPLQSLAHGSRFAEFAPDISSPLKISLVQTPSQPFRPGNDFIGGFDIWIDNTGASGTASFGLRDSANNLLASKTVTIPSIQPFWTGTRFHVDFDSQIPISNSQIYKIRVVSSMPELRLYRANRSQLLQHTTTGYQDYEVEATLLGSQEQNFTFKFALYETQETSPPIITNATTSAMSLTAFKLDFNANEPVDFKVDYGPASQGLNQGVDFTGSYRSCLPGQKFCSATMNVQPSTNYNYLLTAKDEWGNSSSINGNFRSLEGPSPTPTPSGTPQGSPSQSPGITLSPSPSASQSPTPSPQTSSGGSPTPSPNNSPIPTPGFSPGTTPSPGNNSPGPKNSSPPQIEVKIDSQSGSNTATQTAIIISWNLQEGADGYRIDIFDSENNLVKRVVVSETTRKLVVEKLAEGRYLIYVYAVKDGELTQIGEPVEFVIGLTKKIDIFSKNKIALIALAAATALGLIALVIKKMRSDKKPPQLIGRSKSIFDKIKDNS